MKANFNYWMLLTLILFSFDIAYSQGTGLILEDEIYNSTTQISEVFASGVKTGELPLKYSLKQHCPKVINQGQIGSCVGWSSGYGAFTIMKAQNEGWTDEETITENAFSALYIYNQVKIGDCGQGSLFSEALKFLKTEGDCLSKDFDYPNDDCERAPDNTHKVAAQSSEYEVKEYFTLFRSTDKAKQKIDQTKLSIAENKPVIIGMLIRENFKYLSKEDKYWDPAVGNTSSAGGHAMVIVGYNEGRQAFEVMNSWGSKWGNDGYFWLKYDDFAKYCLYGYQLLVKKKKIEIITNVDDKDPFAPNSGTGDVEEADVLEMEAEFIFRYPTGYDDENDKILFTEAKTSFNGKYYELVNHDFEEFPQFQIVTQKITKDKYVYVFSIDPDNKPMIHWPRNEKFNQKFFSINEGALVPYSRAVIVIPGKDNAMIKDKVGTDYLFVLYSDEPIKDFTDRVEYMAEHPENYIEAMQDTFGERLIPTTDISYQSNKMKFATTTSSGGTITPIVLKVEK